MYAGGLMSPMQRCFSDHGLSAIVGDILSSIDAYLRFAMHAWSLEYTSTAHQRLMVDTYERQKANGQLEKTAGSPSQRLAQ